MAIQDDIRERELRSLFNLEKPEAYGRSDVDAVLDLDGSLVPDALQGRTVPFELKSSSGGGIGTVRDFGRDHVVKWRRLHWLVGIYVPSHDGPKLSHCYYGSPERMWDWIGSKWAYVAPDRAMADCLPALLTASSLGSVVGRRDRYELADVRALMKNQWSAERYTAAADLPELGYSPEAMLGALRERCRYVIERGSTLNNPKIPLAYFQGFERIERNHAVRLRELVVEELLGDGESVPEI